MHIFIFCQHNDACISREDVSHFVLYHTVNVWEICCLPLDFMFKVFWQWYSPSSHLRPGNLFDSPGALWSCLRLKEDVYSRVMATAVPPKYWERDGGEGGGEERKGTHSWWISHFGLWPGSHPITFKLAAACKIFHISHRVPHPLLGTYAPTTTLINQPPVKKN